MFYPLEKPKNVISSWTTSGNHISTYPYLYIKGVKFRGFWPFSRNFVPAKIPAEFEIVFLLIFDQSMIFITVYRIFLLSNEIRVSVKYFITITLISNRKIDIQLDFRFLFLLKPRN